MSRYRFFITGTDTDVGKTVVTACLARILMARGLSVAVAKPFECGSNQDSRFLKHSTGQDSTWDRWAFPYKLKAAMAPAMAAEKEGVKLSIPKAETGLRKLERMNDVMLVEGAGGLMVPIRDRFLILDLMVKLGYPVIVVARYGLGTINHSLLTLAVLAQRRCPVAGLIFNQTSPGKIGELEKKNPTVVAQLGNVKILGMLPYTPKIRRQVFPPLEELNRYLLINKLLRG